MRQMRFAALALFLVLGAGCGKESGDATGSPQTSGPASPPGAPATSAAASACSLLTQADATALFEKPAASQDSVSQTPDANVHQCLWRHGYPDNSSQLVQLVTYDNDMAYSAPPDSQPFALGDKGNVVVSSMSGVDVSWVQKGKTFMLSYSTVGPSAPKATARAEQVKALAKKIEGKI